MYKLLDFKKFKIIHQGGCLWIKKHWTNESRNVPFNLNIRKNYVDTELVTAGLIY